MSSLSKISRTRPGRSLYFLLVLAALLFLGYVWANCLRRDIAVAASDNPLATELETQEKDYSRFTHTNPYHSRMPCLLCHRRDTNSPGIAFPGRAGHTPCIGCHALQFS